MSNVPIQPMQTFWVRFLIVATVCLAGWGASAAPPTLAEARLTRPDGSSLRRLFPGERVVQLRAAVKDPGEQTVVKASLTTVDVLGNKNRRLAEQQAKVPKPTTGNRSELVFSFSLPRDWPPGTYRVDVQLNTATPVQRPFEVRASE